MGVLGNFNEKSKEKIACLQLIALRSYWCALENRRNYCCQHTPGSFEKLRKFLKCFKLVEALWHPDARWILKAEKRKSCSAAGMLNISVQFHSAAQRHQLFCCRLKWWLNCDESLLIVIFWWISLCRSQSNCFCLCGFPRMLTLITLWCSVNLSPSVIRLKCHITSCQFFTLASTTPEMKVLRVYMAPIICDRHVGAKAGHWTAAGHGVVLLQISLSYFTVMLPHHFTAVGIFSDYHVLSVSTACSLLDLKYGILRTENLLDKLSWIHWRFGVCVCVCVRALCINTCWTRTNP